MPRYRILAASLAIYLVWGSAYLAMKIGLDSVPPLLLASSRLLLAGTLMTGFALARGHRPRRAHLPTIFVAALLLFGGGHGFLYWGQQRVSSGLGAVLFATIPLWVVLIEGFAGRGVGLGWRVLAGLLSGTLGILVLVGPARILGGGRADLSGALAITIAALSWAVGSIYCTRAQLPASGALAGGLEMFSGGALLLLFATLGGEWRGFHPAQLSRHALEAIAYLALVSSLVGFSCYLWLLKVASASRVATYAYVTPLVAVALGASFAHEPVTLRTLGAIALLLGAVGLIVRAQSQQPTPVLAAELDSQGAVSS